VFLLVTLVTSPWALYATIEEAVVSLSAVTSSSGWWWSRVLHVGIRKRRLYGNAGDRCLGGDNSSVVILTGVSTVITKGQLSSNGHRYIRRGLYSKDSLGMTAVEDSRSLAATRDR
jgi:hypothetical protein